MTRSSIASGRRAVAAPTIPVTLFALAALLPSAAGAATLFGLVDTGELFASTDGGTAWSARSTLPVRDAVALAAGSSSTELFLATASGTVYRSTDAGVAWAAVSAVAASDVVALDAQADRMLLYTRAGSVLASLDDGASFGAVGVMPAGEVVSATHVGTTALALTRSGGVYRSEDGGVSWAAIAALPVSNAVEIAALHGRLYLLTATGDLARAEPPWTSWSFIGTLSQTGMTTLVVAAGELLACTGAGEVAASANGTTWSWRGAIGQLTVRALGSDESVTTGVDAGPVHALRFAPPWPNPARGRIHLVIELAEPAEVTVEAFDAAGRVVARPIAREILSAGRNARWWSPKQLPTGAYYLQARISGRMETRRVIWLSGD